MEKHGNPKFLTPVWCVRQCGKVISFPRPPILKKWTRRHVRRFCSDEGEGEGQESYRIHSVGGILGNTLGMRVSIPLDLRSFHFLVSSVLTSPPALVVPSEFRDSLSRLFAAEIKKDESRGKKMPR
jgi:hypothetical protein